MPESAGSRALIVAIETDATRYPGEHARRPLLLARSAAAQMLSHLAADLGALIPGAARCSLVAPGALFDQTQVLRPRFPIFAALRHYGEVRATHGSGERVSLGADEGRLPVPELQPEDDIPLGLLQLLPMVITGPAGHVGEVGAAMEHRFLERGQVSAHTARWLEAAFGIALKHARFMTLTDLLAMVRLQLEHFGFEPLWALIDAALHSAPDPVKVKPAGGPRLEWHDGSVRLYFETFDEWARSSDGRDLDSGRGQLAGAYAEWTRITRQYLATLAAHRIPVEVHPSSPSSQIAGEGFLVERSTIVPANGCAGVTEHSFGALGTLCLTAVRDGIQSNYYPLSPQGLNAMHADIRHRGLAEFSLAYPGTVLYDPVSRALLAERLVAEDEDA